MIVAYLEIGQAIKDQVKAIKWIDIDKGQLDNPESFNSIIVPGVLIGLADITWSQLAGRYQQGEGTIIVKTVFVLPAQTHLTDPMAKQSLKILAISEDVSEAVSSVPGILSRIKTKEYPSVTYYVIEETFLAVFKSGPTFTQKTVALQINPFLVNPANA